MRGSSAEQQRALAEEFAADDEMYNKLVAEMSEKDKALFAKLRAMRRFDVAYRGGSTACATACPTA